MSLATVYRNLRRLAAEGLLRERAEAGRLRFDGNTDPHDHFTCLACGRVFDVPTRAGGTVPPRVMTAAGFEILDRRVEFYGRCVRCRRSPLTTQRRKHGRAKSQGI